MPDVRLTERQGLQSWTKAKSGSIFDRHYLGYTTLLLPMGSRGGAHMRLWHVCGVLGNCDSPEKDDLFVTHMPKDPAATSDSFHMIHR